jgi:hypothetical protein
MTVDTQKLREAASGAKEFASVGVVQWPHTAKAHINGLADAVATCCGEIERKGAEVARLREALGALVRIADENPHCPIGHAVEHGGYGADKARAALARATGGAT